jgi:hypothetical protein
MPHSRRISRVADGGSGIDPRKSELSVGDTHSHRYRVANIDNGRDSRSKKQK